MDEIDPYFLDTPSSGKSEKKEEIDPYFTAPSTPRGAPAQPARPVERDPFVETAAGAGHGLAKLAAGLPGLPGDIMNIWGMGGDWLRSKGALPPIPEDSFFRKRLPTSEETIEAAKPYVTALKEKTPEGLPRYAELLAETVPAAGKSFIKYGAIPATAIFGAEESAKNKVLPQWAPAAAGPIAAGITAGLGALHGRGSAAERLLSSATRGATPQQVAEAESLFNVGQSINYPITRAEALEKVTGNATNMGNLQRTLEGLGGLRPFFAQRPAQAEQAGRALFEQIAPPNFEPSMIGPRVAKAAESAFGETPEAKKLAEEIWRVGPRTTAEQAGEVIQPELLKVLERREGMRNALATPEYEAARNAPATIPMDGGFGFRDVTKHYDQWPTVHDPDTGNLRYMTRAEIEQEKGGLANLRGEVSELRKEAKPITKAEQSALESQDLEDVFGQNRLAAEVAIGSRKLAPPPSLLGWMAREGGIFDARGDVRSILGGKKVPGLIRGSRDELGKTGGRGLDDWAEKLYNDYPEHFPEGRPSPNDVLSMIADADAGHPPRWWVGEDRLKLEQDADAYRDLFDQLGASPKNLQEAAAAIKGSDPALMQRLYEKHRAASELPGAEASLAAREGRVKDITSRAESPGVNITERMPVIGLEPTKFGQVNVSNVANVLDGMLETAKGDIRNALVAARKTLNTPSGELDASVAGIHNARVALDDLISKTNREGTTNAARQLMGAKEALDKSLEAVPEYAKAVETYKNASAPLKPFEQPSISKVVERDQYGKEFEIPAEQVAPTIEKGGASAAQAFSEIASPEAKNAYLNRLATKMLDEAGGGGFALDPGKLRQYMLSHEDELRRFPELRDRITQIANARDSLEELKATRLGKLLDKKEAKDAANSLFPMNPDPNSEREIARTMGALNKADPAAAKDLLRFYLERTFNQATKDLQSGPSQYGGATFAAKIAGNDQAHRNIVAAIEATGGKSVAEGFARFLDIASATGTRQRIGSNTSFNDEIKPLLKQGIPVEEATKLVFSAGINAPRKVAEWLDRWRMGKNIDEIVDLITKKENADTFRRLAIKANTPQIASNLIGRLMISAETAKISQSEPRQQRASGGRVDKRDYPAKKSSRLEKEARRAHRDWSNELRPMMDMPDHVIANALRAAKH